MCDLTVSNAALCEVALTSPLWRREIITSSSASASGVSDDPLRAASHSPYFFSASPRALCC